MAKTNHRGYFITATGTEVGKTYVAALLVKALREQGVDAGYFKPALSDAYVQDGTLVPGDAAYVCKTAGLDVDPASLVSFIYATPVAPHLAARQEHKPEVSLEKIIEDFNRHSAKHDLLVVEGCGGIVCPLNESTGLMLSDVMQALALPLLVVAPAGLGAINATLLTVAFARQLELDIAGIILNGYDKSNVLHSDNALQIERLTGLPIVAYVARGDATLELDKLELDRE